MPLRHMYRRQPDYFLDGVIPILFYLVVYLAREEDHKAISMQGCLPFRLNSLYLPL